MEKQASCRATLQFAGFGFSLGIKSLLLYRNHFQTTDVRLPNIFGAISSLWPVEGSCRSMSTLWTWLWSVRMPKDQGLCKCYLLEQSMQLFCIYTYESPHIGTVALQTISQKFIECISNVQYYCPNVVRIYWFHSHIPKWKAEWRGLSWSSL